ncbi:MAG: hypothetical protein KatS3mg100_504 [Candidatus Parcubacteria bacterium]|nr:MAG: hypothetical protein KatS3mg100_504 [Candidatus Parcubacteria bacterium]
MAVQEETDKTNLYLSSSTYEVIVRIVPLCVLSKE